MATSKVKSFGNVKVSIGAQKSRQHHFLSTLSVSFVDIDPVEVSTLPEGWPSVGFVVSENGRAPDGTTGIQSVGSPTVMTHTQLINELLVNLVYE